MKALGKGRNGCFETWFCLPSSYYQLFISFFQRGETIIENLILSRGR
jgi:hypothetical protein